ncbi:hypothetical protein HQ584_11980 [Patescibacteria group bacterium]|nr:hypothetical protein [Patescibacteria group bacterium]
MNFSISLTSPHEKAKLKLKVSPGDTPAVGLCRNSRKRNCRIPTREGADMKRCLFGVLLVVREKITEKIKEEKKK